MTESRGPGRLIALEGIDGAGKSTVGRALAHALRRQGWSVGLRREPSDRRLGALAQAASVDDPWTGAIYFTVDRYLDRPNLLALLHRHQIVLTDRSYFSTLAYQGGGLPPSERRRLERIQRSATVRPDRVLLLDLPLPVALRRVGGRSGGARGPLERERTLRKVVREYRSMARRPGWIVLDARRPVGELVTSAIERLRLGTPRRRARRRSEGR